MMGNFGGHVARSAKKWFWKVLIARLAAFRWCWFGGVSSKDKFYFIIASLRSAEHLLSSIYCLFSWPWRVSFLWRACHAFAISCACQLLSGAARIVLLSKL